MVGASLNEEPFMNANETDLVLKTIDGAIATLTLNRPESSTP